MKMCTVVVVVDVVRQEKRVWDITLDSPTRQSELACYGKERDNLPPSPTSSL